MGKYENSLLSRASKILARLSNGGWDKLFKQHGLDVCASDLQAELLRPLDQINRNCPGFEDFAEAGMRAVEPGKPALSLLIHGLASPNVVSYIESHEEVEITKFPTSADLEMLENLVYGLVPPTIEDVRMSVDGVPLAVVVFAKEYRVAVNTVHQKHADMCYSRTGVARIGTSNMEYLDKARGYLPYDEESSNKIRVLPCRYAAYIAALVDGDRDTHGPMRFIDPASAAQDDNEPSLDKVAGRSASEAELVKDKIDPGDKSRRFWVPVHKLFSGKDCLSGYDLNVTLSTSHLNEKLRRVHLMFGRLGHDGGWHEPDISNSPFKFTDGIAEFSKSDGEGLLVPQVHESLVSVAKYKHEGSEAEKDLTYIVPNSEKLDTGVFSSSLYIPSLSGGARSAPEYVHARFAVDYKGSDEKDLNELPNVAEIVKKGGYRAKHLIDYTGDGWIDVTCPELNLDIPTRLAAFSLVASPDYFIKVKQRDLMQWWEQSVSHSIKKTIWPANPGLPEALSDQRIAANVELEGPGFNENDDTMTAIIGQLNVHGGTRVRMMPPRYFRSSMLTDGASGVFAPGWDVSIDQMAQDNSNGESLVTFFSTHGLGSPFPEDAKLCAALSSFWPAVAPDITRTFQPNPRYATATPLLDKTIGQGGAEPWDGVYGPRIIDETKKIIEYTNLDYGDYVRASLDNVFNMDVIGDINHQEYVARTVVMARVYQALGAKTTEEKVKYTVYSFKHIDADSDQEFKDALAATKITLSSDYAFRFQIFEAKVVEGDEGKPFDKVWVRYDEMKTIYADSISVLLRDDKNEWTAKHFRD